MAGASYTRGTTTPENMDSPQSDWSLQLSQLLAMLGQNQFNWARDQFNQGMDFSRHNAEHYLQLADTGASLAQNLLGRYRDVFEPMMDRYIAQASSYNSEDRQRFMMGRAESTVAQADQAGRDAAERRLQSFGINPNSGRYEDLLLTSRIQDAAARAGAGTQAALNTADRGRAMTAQIAQMGQNIPGMTVNALQSAYTGVTGAENAILGMLNTGANLANTATGMLNAAGGANKLPPVGNQSQQRGGSSQSDPNSGKSADDKEKKGDGAAGGGRGGDPRGNPDPFNLKGGGKGGIGRTDNPFPGREQGAREQGNKDQGTGEKDNDGGVDPTFFPGLPDWLAGGQWEAPQGEPQWPENAGNTPNPQSTTDPDRAPDMGGWDFPTEQQPDPWQQLDGPPDTFNDRFGDWPGAENAQDDPQGAIGAQDYPQDDYPQQDYPQDNYPQQDYPQQDYPQDDYPADNDDNNGGAYAAGGNVRARMSPTRGRQTDDVPARLNVGEFVVPKDVVAHKGSEFFANLIKKSRMARAGMAGAPPRAKMKPALRLRPTFVSGRM